MAEAYVDCCKQLNFALMPAPREVVSIRDIIADQSRGYAVKLHQEYPAAPLDYGDYYGKHIRFDLLPNSTVSVEFKNTTSTTTYVVSIENLRVMGLGGTMITPDNKIIEESLWSSKKPYPNHLMIDAESLLKANELIPAPQFINSRVGVTTQIFTVFGHVLGQNILTAVGYEGLDIDLIYTSHYSQLDYLQDAYTYLGIDRSRVFEAQPYHQLAFKEAHVTLPNSPYTINKREYGRTLVKCMGLGGIEPQRKVFSLRSPTSGTCMSNRFIANVDEVAAYLTRRGFERIYWERLSFAEKIQTAAEVKFAVDEWGSQSLHYMYFSDRCKIIKCSSTEILHQNGRTVFTYDPTMITQGMLQNTMTTYIECPNIPVDNKYADVCLVDIKRLEQAIDELEATDFEG